MRLLSLWSWFMEGIWKCLKMWAKEYIQCYKQNLMGNSSESSKTRISTGMAEMKARSWCF
jgi:hypothetical protein